MIRRSFVATQAYCEHLFNGEPLPMPSLFSCRQLSELRPEELFFRRRKIVDMDRATLIQIIAFLAEKELARQDKILGRTRS